MCSHLKFSSQTRGVAARLQRLTDQKLLLIWKRYAAEIWAGKLIIFSIFYNTVLKQNNYFVPLH